VGYFEHVLSGCPTGIYPVSGETADTQAMRPLPRSKTRSRFHTVIAAAFFATLLGLPFTQTLAAAQQLVCSPSPLAFGGVAIGQTETQSAVLTNTGQTSVRVSAIAVDASEFQVSGLTLPVQLDVGQSVGVNLSFTPSASGLTRGTLTVSSNASNSTLQFVVAGTGVESDTLVASPASVSFGTVALGSSATASVVITNEQSSTQTLTTMRVTGDDHAFSVSGATFPVTLAPHQSVRLKISFRPQLAREIGGSVFFYGARLNIPTVGIGAANTVGQLTVSPSSMNFGSVDVGSTSAQSFTLTATGGSVTVTSESSNNGQFSISGLTVPVTLSAGQTAEAKLIFTPTAAGSASGVISVNSNASDTKLTEPVAGTGVVTQYSVTLSWNASTSSVSGYNIYRGTSAGAYSRINSSLDPSTTYSDNTVASGTTYYYAATSVSTSGQESGYSSPVKVAIP
jgi:hypothetical protein